MKKRTILKTIALSVCALALAAVGVALANQSVSELGTRPIDTVNNVEDLPAFQTPIEQTDELDRVRSDLKSKAPENTGSGLLESVNYSKMRSVDIDGSSLHGWIAPTKNNGVCMFAEDPIDGYGASCSYLAEVERGVAYLMLSGGSTGPLKDAGILIVPTTGTQPTPVAKSPDGSTRTLAKDRFGIVTGLIHRGEQVDVGGNTVSLSPAPTGPPSR